MVKSIIREYHWTPKDIDNLFFDDDDYHGIFYIFNDLVEANEQVKKARNKK